MTGNDQSDTRNSHGEGMSIFRLVLLALVIALLLRIFLVQPFNIPSGSMRPTLLVGDYIYVSKTAYGYSRASLVWPLTKLPIRGRLFNRLPTRGDIVVFKNKKAGNTDYVKRLIGLPGDEIFIREGTVYINDKEVVREALGLGTAICDGELRNDVPIYREILPNGVVYRVQECDGDDGFLDTRGPYNVPSGHFFALGDNRDKSRDSRVESEVGTVPFDDLVGRVDRVIISFDGRKSALWQIWNWFSGIRFSRIFHEIR